MSNYEIHSVSRSSASISFYGIPYADFDRTGHWAVWCISKMFEASRALALYNGFLDLAKIYHQDETIVIAKQEIKLNPKVHQIKLKPQSHLLFDVKLLEVGERSITNVTELRDGSTKERLGETFLKFVRFSRKTRRSISFPEWYIKSLELHESPQKQQFRSKTALPDIPDNAFKFRLVPNYSDMDRNNHVNQSSYIKFCMDAATHASLSGHYVHFNEDMCLYAPLLWTISYVGECRANDELSIYTWQSESSSPEHIEFSILLNDRLIFHASTIFEKEAKKVPSSLSKI